jgi:hypothetical protein
MDFEHAAQRLKREQSKMKSQRRGRVPEISPEARLEAERRKKQQQRLAVEREQQKRQADGIHNYYEQCERK